MTERMHTNFACTHCGEPIYDSITEWHQGKPYCWRCWQGIQDYEIDVERALQKEAEHE